MTYHVCIYVHELYSKLASYYKHMLQQSHTQHAHTTTQLTGTYHICAVPVGAGARGRNRGAVQQPLLFPPTAEPSRQHQRIPCTLIVPIGKREHCRKEHINTYVYTYTSKYTNLTYNIRVCTYYAIVLGDSKG